MKKRRIGGRWRISSENLSGMFTGQDAWSILYSTDIGPISISIHPDYKRKGYGLKLLNFALDKAREYGIGALCMEGNIDFYSHADFTINSII